MFLSGLPAALLPWTILSAKLSRPVSACLLHHSVRPLEAKSRSLESYRPSLSTAEGSGKAICILTRVTVRVECRRCSLKGGAQSSFHIWHLLNREAWPRCILPRKKQIYNPAHIHAFDWLHFMGYSSVYLPDHGSIHSSQRIHFLLIFVYLRYIFPLWPPP